MTRTYAAAKLLALGPLTLREFVEITGWRYRCCVSVLARLRDAQRVRLLRHGANGMSSVYEAA